MTVGFLRRGLYTSQGWQAFTIGSSKGHIKNSLKSSKNRCEVLGFRQVLVEIFDCFVAPRFLSFPLKNVYEAPVCIFDWPPLSLHGASISLIFWANASGLTLAVSHCDDDDLSR